MSAGLLLVFVLHIRFLAQRLTERNLWLAQLNLYFIFGLKLACHYFQLLFADTVEQCLTHLTVIHDLECRVFLYHFLKCLRNLVVISLVDRLISHVCIRCRGSGTDIQDRICLS